MMSHENEENENTGRHDHNQRENQDNIDMLSNLSDCLLVHILSLLTVKEAVQTCILSSRWEHLWKNLNFTALTLHCSDFTTVKGFVEFVTEILSLCDNSTPLDALDFECMVPLEPHVLEKIYNASHNVSCLRFSYPPYRVFSPSFLVSCHSLTSLDIGSQYGLHKFPNSLNLTALTYLKLHLFSFRRRSRRDRRVEPFSTFKRLNTLILYRCIVQDRQQPLYISSTTLLNLSINSDYVVFPGEVSSKIELFTPSLCTFTLTCCPFPKLSGSHLSSIEQVSIDARDFTPRLDLLNFLIELTSIKSLTITLQILEVLSLVHDISKLKFTSLCNLKSLNLKLDLHTFPVVTRKLELAYGKSWRENTKLQKKIKAGLEPIYSARVVRMIKFLLQNSPSAKFDIMLDSVRELN